MYASLIVRATNETESIINATLFSDVIGVNAMTEIHLNPNDDMEVFLQTPKLLSDIIVSVVVERPRRNLLHAHPHMNTAHYIRSSHESEEWIITIVLNTMPIK